MGSEEGMYTVEEIIYRDLAEIYLGNLKTVDSDLNLPVRGRYGSAFLWKSGEERFITDDGKVHQPLHGMGNREVVLTVTAFLNGKMATRSFAANVLEQKVEMKITSVDPVKITVLTGTEPKLPPYVIVRCLDGRVTVKSVTWNRCEKTTEEESCEVNGVVEGTEIPALAEISFQKELPLETCPARQGDFIPIYRVRLLPGTIFYDREQDMLSYLRNVSNDSMLYNFRKACGLDTRGASPMTGWDADDCKLKGHTTGHYLSGLALAYAATGEKIFREKAGGMVTGLRECQLAFERSKSCHRGFLSAYSEEQFDLLEKYTKYPEIWAPYYTLDKIMAGLIDCYQLAECREALEILRPLGEWVWNRLSRLPESQRQKMWSMYIAGEFGGMIGTMTRLGEITGDARNLEAARFFDNEKLFHPMELGIDTLEGMHANQHIPQAIGQLELYRLEGKIRDYRIGRNFWKMVTGAHAYCIGGVGEAELFHQAKMMTSYLTDKTAESCASYNMCRLTGQLFAYTEDARMMDYYEWTLCNHLMASASHTADGGTTYFMPLGPGMRKAWSTSENSCCHGTGMESRFRYLENIFFQDRDSLRICLFADCVLSGENALEMRTSEDHLAITAKADMTLPLRIRIPGWVKAWTAELNGENLAAEA